MALWNADESAMSVSADVHSTLKHEKNVCSTAETV